MEEPTTTSEAALAPPDSPRAPLRQLRDSLAADVLAGRLSPGAFPARYSAGADEFLSGLFAAATARRGGDGYALVAVGGYGRAELCPGSDLDVVLVHDRRKDVKEVADAIWYRVWDSGVRLDHSVRTPKEVLGVAGEDLRVVLGLLDGRLVCGDQELAGPVLDKVRQLWRTHHRKTLVQLAQATRERHKMFGDLAYLLEPDLKESAGGLRDIEAMSAFALAMPSMAAVLFPPSLEKARDLLLSARVALQARTGTSSDRLLLQEQDEVASVLGYEDADAFARALAAEGREVMWAVSDGWRRAESALAGPSGRRGGRDVEVGRGVVIRDCEIALSQAADISLDPALVLRVAAAAARHAMPVNRSALERLATERPELSGPWPEEMRDALVSLLEYGHAATEVIEVLDRLRLVEWLLPEWSVVRHRPQRNAYHRFTVDRHLLEASAEAARLIREVERPDLLLIGALLHDIGKGRPGDHSDVGRDLAVGIARRMGYGARDVAVIGRLVKRHLLLADTATRRDLDAPETIELVAEAVGDVLTLELLAALTEADSLATGPAAWGQWKASLVSELVSNVRAMLEGHPAESTSMRQMSPDLAELVEAGELAVRIRGSELAVVAPDRPGLFALVAGTLALHRLDIRRATALGIDKSTAGDEPGGPGARAHPGVAVELFEVERDPQRPVDQQALLADLDRALRGELPIDAHIRAVEKAAAAYRRPATADGPRIVVLIDESASAAASVVEVRAPDSHGLAYRLASVLATEGLDVVSARIATLGHEVVDSFYVRDQATGLRPDADRLEALRGPLMAAAEIAD